MTPLVSVITVSKNDPEGLQKTCNSVCRQSFAYYEHLVVDAGGCDEASAFLALHAVNAESFTYISEPDGGIFDAMNKGLYMARGDYVIFMNSGDEFFSDDVLETVAGELAGQYQIIGGRVMTTVEGCDMGLIDPGEWLAHQGAFIDRALHLKFPFDVRQKVFGDLDVWLRLRSIGEFVPRRISTIVARMELGGVGNNPKFLTVRFKDKMRLRIKHRQWGRLCADAAWLGLGVVISRVGGNGAYQKQIRALDFFRSVARAVKAKQK